MGEAKKRGTYEERVARAIACKQKEKIDRQHEAQKWWDNLTDTEREQEINLLKQGKARSRKTQMFLASLASTGMLDLERLVRK